MTESKIYKLPDGLDGVEVEGVLASIIGPGYVRVTVPGIGMIEMPMDCLTEVTPPLPAEPPNGYVGRAGAQIWERHDMFIENDSHPEKRWWRTGVAEVYSWPEAVDCMLGVPLIELRPDPAVDSPDLPWSECDDGSGDAVRVDPVSTGCCCIWIEITPDWHTPEEAELRAAVIWAAARNARASAAQRAARDEGEINND